ncbi:EF-hand domain-containing protein [Mesorhizobium sp.]|uniref:EF-hand domain-containing protein n=1 Tax=Mesorhizobium sp. TaxID=1871066 RepID=UPI0025FA3CC4|nr:EF-hand domain-containing protein [Mesorhizobium sp.]
MQRSALIAALLMGLVPLSAAHAQGIPGKDTPGKRILQRLDTNGDGAISRDEMLAARERMFTKLDRKRGSRVAYAPTERSRARARPAADVVSACSCRD